MTFLSSFCIIALGQLNRVFATFVRKLRLLYKIQALVSITKLNFSVRWTCFETESSSYCSGVKMAGRLIVCYRICIRKSMSERWTRFTLFWPGSSTKLHARGFFCVWKRFQLFFVWGWIIFGTFICTSLTLGWTKAVFRKTWLCEDDSTTEHVQRSICTASGHQWLHFYDRP